MIQKLEVNYFEQVVLIMWRGCFKDANATIFQMQSHDYYTDIIVDIDTTT